MYPIYPIYPILSYLSYLILSYPILSYLILSYPILSYLILSYPIYPIHRIYLINLIYLSIYLSIYRILSFFSWSKCCLVPAKALLTVWLCQSAVLLLGCLWSFCRGGTRTFSEGRAAFWKRRIEASLSVSSMGTLATTTTTYFPPRSIYFFKWSLFDFCWRRENQQLQHRRRSQFL